MTSGPLFSFLLYGLVVSGFSADRFVEIPAGSFLMGCSHNDALCDEDEGKKGGVSVYVNRFYMDKYETSVAEYRECVNAGKCEKPFDYRRTHYCNYGAPGRDNYPVNCVNWNNAQAYCRYRGGSLANEAQWEKAARGGKNTPYPWGYESASCKNAVMDPGNRSESDTETDGCWRDLSWERNSFAPNAFGLFDMVGGTSEWVLNWYQEDAHQMLYQKGEIAGPKNGEKKVIKGGSWDEKHWAQRVSNRFAKPVTGNPDLYGSNGIRCVIEPQ